MSNNYINADDEPTLPVRPSDYQNQSQQGKLVLGSFKNQSSQSQRRPYQYSQQPDPAGQATAYPNRAQQASPNVGQYPYYQAPQSTYSPRSRREPRRRGKGCLI